MKTEIRNAASNAAHEIVKSLPNLIPVLVAKKEGYALDTGFTDENGKPIYAVIDVTIKNTEDNATGTAKAFDLDACVQALQDKMSAPKKEKKTKEADPEAEAKRAARMEKQNALELWCLENLPTGDGMTTTEIATANPDVADMNLMVGTMLKNIAEKNPIVQRNVIKGKPYYSKA